MKKIAALVLIATAALSSCGETVNYSRECREQGGSVITIGHRASCVVDGAVVREWAVSQ